jgi:hypothetical protein
VTIVSVHYHHDGLIVKDMGWATSYGVQCPTCKKAHFGSYFNVASFRCSHCAANVPVPEYLSSGGVVSA